MSSALKICAILVASLLIPGVADARDIVIHAGRLIDGVSSTERRNVSINVRDDRIVSVTEGFVTPSGAEVIDLSDKTVMPGLIDTHVHFLLEFGKVPLALALTTHNSFDDVLDGADRARRTLMAGFTSVRDLGGYTPAIVALRDAQKSGKIEAPRMWVAGSILSPTGGHGDFANGFDHQLLKPEWTDGVFDGPVEAAKRVREHHRAGANLIKIVPSGGVSTDGDDPQAQLMTDEEIKAVVDTAHSLHMKVAAHAHGTQAIAHAVALGVDSIEHGTYADAADYKAMKERGAFMVPTIIAGETVVELAKQHPGMLSKSAEEKALVVGPLMSRNAYQAWKAGVRVAFGTDAGVYPHGNNAREFTLLAKAGIPPMDTLIAATSNAAALIGDEADIGSIQQGKYADIIATTVDPLTDLTALEHVEFVMQGGRILKSEPKRQ